MQLVLLLTFILVCYTNGMIEQIPLPGHMEECFLRYSRKTSIVETVGESIASFCFDQYMWRASKEHGWKAFNISQEAFEWAHGLLKKADLHRTKRQAISPRLRIRKEYRRLTEEERNNFHLAIQLLKADSSVLPNRYDALSAIHQGIVTTSAHGGPNFLSFHRVYLLMFENALREKIPTVTIPYWDSTLDQAMMDPTQSVIYTDGFMGNGFGIVNSGPFAHWLTLSGPLIRNIGQSGELFRRQDIEVIVSSVRLAQITEPNAPINSSLEFLHNQVHLWTDGQMGSLNTAAHDPVFWVHHAYVDYVWELFRRNQRAFGIDPTRDYPVFVNNTLHLPGAAMGLSNFLNMDGLGDMFTSMIYNYEPSPTCSQAFQDCGSRYLTCSVRNFRPTCVSLDRFAAPSFFSARRNFVNPQAAMASVVQNRVRQQQAINSARAQAQMQLFAQQRMQQQQMQQQQQQRQQGLQQQFQQQMLQSQIQQSSFASMNNQNGQKKEMENGVPDDSEGTQLRKKRAAMPTGKTPANNAAYIANNQIGNTMPTNGQTGSPTIQQYMVNLQEMFQNFQNSTMSMQSFATSCPTIPVSHGYQNTFNINGQSDINQWVYIPVKIIYQRPPKFTYTSYPVVNGEAEEASDVYSPNAFNNIRTALNNGTPASYHKCRQQQTESGKVFVSSQGLNYMGKYREYAIVDHRLAISVSTTYVAVKSPTNGASNVYLYAYDSCGRICQPFCRLKGSAGFQRCTGAVMVTSGHPKLYSTNYGNAVMNFWQFSQNGGSPLMNDANVHIQFHCNFQEAWPFPAGPSAAAMRDELEEPEPAQAPPMRRMIGQTKRLPTACHIGNGCIVPGGCQRCRNGRQYACLGACTMYTSCRDGVHFIRTCPRNMWFDPDEDHCRPGMCMANYNQWWFQKPIKPDFK